MSESVKCVRKNCRLSKKEYPAYDWVTHLQSFEAGKTSFVPVQAFANCTTVDFSDSVKDGTVLEVRVRDYDEVVKGKRREIRWVARIKKCAGFRVLIKFLGTDRFQWINILSLDIHYFSSAGLMDPDMKTYSYIPPPPIEQQYFYDTLGFMRRIVDPAIMGQGLAPHYEADVAKLNCTKFKAGQRLELLNYAMSTEIRVARIKEVCGRRLNVLVHQKDSPRVLADAADDRQAHYKNAQYWIDEESFYIFPVGWAALNGYDICAQPDYLDHTKQIARMIQLGMTPIYHEDDITFAQLMRNTHPAKIDRMEVGQKFELLDPLSQRFQHLCVATILKFCESYGYIIIGMDGPDAEGDSFPIHIDNVFMFPVGYAEKYKLRLQKPDGFKGNFRWDEYLEKQKAVPIPLDCFKQIPHFVRMDKFQVGAHLEAADMCENNLICSATIKSIHGRLLYVNFDGWSADFDELYDIDSHDILPAGWCEAHNYPLQEPQRSK